MSEQAALAALRGLEFEWWTSKRLPGTPEDWVYVRFMVPKPEDLDSTVAWAQTALTAHPEVREVKVFSSAATQVLLEVQFRDERRTPPLWVVTSILGKERRR